MCTSAVVFPLWVFLTAEVSFWFFSWWHKFRNT